jgi:alpha-tubulin suppressor-like RCC1 family protein
MNSSNQTNVPPGLSNVIAVAADGTKSMALKTDGTLVVWGDGATIPPELGKVVAIRGCGHVSLALKADRKVALLWPAGNVFGQNGIPTSASNVVAIAGAGDEQDNSFGYGLALRNDNTIIGWGWNAFGQISFPVAATNVVALAAGSRHVLALVNNFSRPLILWQTPNQTVFSGADVSMSAGIVGTQPLAYRWLFNGIGMGTTMDSSLVITNAQPGNSGNYRLMITNAYGSAESSEAALTVLASAPVFLNQPSNQFRLPGSSVTFAPSAVGSLPLTYQWSFAGVAIPSATDSMLTLTNLAGTNDGVYSLSVSNSFGTSTSSNAFLDVLDTGEALNATNLIWTTSGDVPWLVQTNVTHDGFAAAQSGLISANQQSYLETSVNGPGTLSFWWRVSSETNNDYVKFSVDNLEAARISGNVNWQQISYYVPNGLHVLSWTYAKNATITLGADAAWLDEVSFPSAAGIAPTIVSSPVSQVTIFSSNVTFRAAVQGTLPLSYQWLFNGTVLHNATNASLSITNVQIGNQGTYAVAITNKFGSTQSSNANLAVINVFAWGAGVSNTANSPNYGQSKIPTNLSGVVAVAGGGYHSLALRSNGLVSAWGYNSQNQTNVPVTLTNATAVSGGLFHSLALRKDGTVTHWGNPIYGLTPVPANVTNVAAISAGWYHNLVLRSNGTVVAWGAGSSPRFWPDANQSMVPTNLTGVMAIAAGGFHSMALRTNGTVVAWGWNDYGQTNVPAGLTNVVAIAAGGTNSYALKNDGTIVAWGDNTYGQLNLPPNATNVAAISAGGAHALALRNDGTMLAWGFNGYGQTNVPPGFTNVAAISAGAFHNVVVLNSGPVTFLAPLNNQTVFRGSNAFLAPAFLGAPPMSFQWLKNEAILNNATNGTLLISNAQPSDAGNYQLVISNSFNTTTSSVARLTVYEISPYFTEQPASQWVPVTSNLTMSATVAGLPPLSFAWRFNGAEIPGATKSTHSITNVQVSNSGNYSLFASNAFGTAISSNAVLTVVDLGVALNNTNLTWLTFNSPAWLPETVVSHDGIAAASTGFVRYTNQSTLLTTVTGPGTLGFWWMAAYVGGSPYYVGFSIDGASPTYLYTPNVWQKATFYLDSGNHTLRWIPAPSSSSQVNCFVDEVSYVAGPTAPVIIGPPLDKSVPAGSNILFSVTAGGTPTLYYQWSFNGTNLPGSTTSILSLQNVQPPKSGAYSVIVSNSMGTTGATAILTVTPSAPWVSAQPVDQKAVPGGNCVFSGTALGSEPLSYQWQFNGVDINGATFTRLVVPKISDSNLGSYRFLATNAYGSTVSTDASLTLVSSSLIAWGQNIFGQATVPASLLNVGPFAGGWDYSVAVNGDGTIASWGFPEPTFSPNPTNVMSIAAGATHILALSSNGTVSAAGMTVPLGLSNIVEIQAGNHFNLALTSDGTILPWGDGGSGVTTLPAGLTNVSSISAHWNHALALKKDGTVTAWGSDFGGSTQVPLGLRDVAVIAAGYYHSLALKNDGTVVAWGYNPYGQTTVPPDLSNVASIAGGMDYSMALKSDGTIVAWGNNSAGQLNIPVTATNVAEISSGDSHGLALLRTPSISIVRQPRSLTMLNHMREAFSVGVIAPEPIIYQWRFNGAPLAASTNAMLVLPDISLANAGAYDVIVTNTFGSRTSVVANLAVQDLRPVIQRDQLGMSGSNFNFNITGPDGLVVVVETSSNLTQWVPVLTNALVNGQFHFTDSKSILFSRRFYRARFEYSFLAQPFLTPSDGKALSGGGFGMYLKARPGQVAVIQVSDNLIDWVPLQTNNLLTGYQYFVDPLAYAFSHRFYRAQFW